MSPVVARVLKRAINKHLVYEWPHIGVRAYDGRHVLEFTGNTMLFTDLFKENKGYYVPNRVGVALGGDPWWEISKDRVRPVVKSLNAAEAKAARG